jgi:hypothetical protein
LDTYQQKISHLKSLFHLASVDKELAKVETTYIRIVAEHLGIDPKELEKFDGNEPDLELPDREYKLYPLFHRLAIVIMLDNVVNEREKHYCFNLGIKMGLHPNAIKEIIDYVSVYGAMTSMPADVMKIFKKYLN